MFERRLYGEDEIFKFARWLVDEYSIPGNEPPDDSVWFAIERYFEDEKEDA